MDMSIGLEPTQKSCSKCKIEQPLSNFHKDPRRCGWKAACKACASLDSAAYYRNNREKMLARNNNQTLYKYGISGSERDARIAAQGGVCAICGKPEKAVPTTSKTRSPKRLAVDHNHDTGEVRGMLCSSCNPGLGYFKDDPDLLERAAAYLRSYAD